MKFHELITLYDFASRRFYRYFAYPTVAKISNMVLSICNYAMHKQVFKTMPVCVKIDITPLCNLKCLSCIHADEKSNTNLNGISFDKTMKISVDQFSSIIEQIKKKTANLSLYHLGDSFMHPDILKLCKIARKAKIGTHISTNFSYHFTDGQIRGIVESGLTTITVCVDGLRQESYAKTRIGGDIELVCKNLETLVRIKREEKSKFPIIEAQIVKYQHNLTELEPCVAKLHSIGVKHISAIWGVLHNFVDVDLGQVKIERPRKPGVLPQCYWPFFFMMVSYKGDVYPCCMHRIGQHVKPLEIVPYLGNTTKPSIYEIWNSPTYNELRQLVHDPKLFNSIEHPENKFCYACEWIWHTDVDNRLRYAYNYKLEDVYDVDPVTKFAKRKLEEV